MPPDAIPVPEPMEGVQRPLTATERNFLKHYIHNYKNCASATEKRDLLSKTVVPKFFAQFFPNITGAARDNMKRVIKVYYQNVNRKTNPNIRIWNKSLSRRQVAYRLFRTEFDDFLAGKDMTEHDGKTNIGRFATEFTLFLSSLTPVQEAKLSKQMQDWEDTAYPPDIQADYHKRFALRYNWIVDLAAAQKLGQYRLTFVIAHETDGSVRTTWFDNISQLHPLHLESFETRFPAELEKMKNMWSHYGQYVQDSEAGAGGAEMLSRELPPRDGHKTSNEVILEVKDGYPLMPPITENMSADKLMRLMRAFIHEHYRLARGGGVSVKAPLKAIAQNASMIAPGCLPPGFVFQDMTNLKQEETYRFCRFIYDRQQTMPMSEVFAFLKISTGRNSDAPLLPARYPGSAVIDEAPATTAPVKIHKKRAPRKKGSRATATLMTDDTPAGTPAPHTVGTPAPGTPASHTVDIPAPHNPGPIAHGATPALDTVAIPGPDNWDNMGNPGPDINMDTVAPGAVGNFGAPVSHTHTQMMDGTLVPPSSNNRYTPPPGGIMNFEFEQSWNEYMSTNGPGMHHSVHDQQINGSYGFQAMIPSIHPGTYNHHDNGIHTGTSDLNAMHSMNLATIFNTGGQEPLQGFMLNEFGRPVQPVAGLHQAPGVFHQVMPGVQRPAGVYQSPALSDQGISGVQIMAGVHSSDQGIPAVQIMAGAQSLAGVQSLAGAQSSSGELTGAQYATMDKSTSQEQPIDVEPPAPGRPPVSRKGKQRDMPDPRNQLQDGVVRARKKRVLADADDTPVGPAKAKRKKVAK